MANRLLKSLTHFAVYAIGVGVLVAAILVTAVRLLLPDIGVYRSEVEAWVGNYMGYPVAIRSMDANWQGWVPDLTLANIDLLNPDETRTLIHFKSARISIDPWASLLARHIVPMELVVSGFEVSIVRMPNGAIHVEELDLSTTPGIISGQSELAIWLFRQKHIRLENGMVSWTDNLHGQQSILLSNVMLTLRTDGARLQLDGSTDLPRDYGTGMDFAFDAQGDLLTSAWTGEFYLSAKDINPDNWYRLRRPKSFNIAGGSADIRVWSRWSGARLASLQGQLSYRDFVAHVGAAKLGIRQLDGSFTSTVDQNGQWRLGLRVHKLDTEHGSWPETVIAVAGDAAPGTSHTGYSTTFSYLRLEDVVPLVLALPQMDDGTMEGLGQVKVRGELHDGAIAFGARPFVYNFGFRELAISGARGLPSVRGASGLLRGDLDSARLEFRDDAVTLIGRGSRGGDLALDGLRGTLEWRRLDQGWRIAGAAMQLQTPEVSIHWSGSVTQTAESGKGPFVDIIAHAGAADATHAIRYLPLSPQGRLRPWMDRAVVSGQMLSADLALRGFLEDFPFAGREGRFSALVNVEDVTLDYSDRWPPVDALTGEIEFDGPELTFRASTGRIFSSTFNNAEARIPNIRAAEKRLFIDGFASGPTDDLGLFVDQSPLNADPILSRLRENLSGGDMDLKLSMSLALGGVGAPAEVSGTLGLDGAQLRSGALLKPLEQVAGAVDFTRTSATGSGLKAMFHNRPVQLEVFGDRAQPSEAPRIVVHGRDDDAFVRERIEDFLPGLTLRQPEFFSRLRGESDWNLSMSFADTDGDGKLNRRIEVRSNLSGMAVDLPAPFGKTTDDAIEFSLARELDTPDPAPVIVRYGDDLVAAFGARTTSDPTPPITLEFGSVDSVPVPAKGIQAGGTVTLLPVSAWWDVLEEVRAAQRRHGGGPALDISASGHVRKLLLLGQQFHDVDVTATRDGDTWNVNLRGAEIDGVVTLPNDAGSNEPIRAHLNRLKLARGEDGGRHVMNPGAIPPLQVSISDLDFHGRALGAAEIVSTPVADGMRIDSATFSKPGLVINGSGTWYRLAENHQSRFAVQVHADTIDNMLQTFGYNVAAVRQGETELTIDAGWDGTPADFEWAKLNGTLQMEVRKGQLLDIEPKAGRLFGLLSFQSLPRRLSLDFSDLFGKGMAFDRIEGTFDISSGNAYTNDLHLRGPSAEVTISGRTGLAVQDYDQIVTVTPQVSETLPVAGALFGPVGIGVGAVLYLAGKMFDSSSGMLDELLRHQYTVTGSWDAPVIEKIDAKDKGSG